MTDKETAKMLTEYRDDTLERSRRWLSLSMEDFNFAKGYQWDPKKADELRRQGRPALTYNKILPVINLISGYQRQNRQDIKVVPVDGQDDDFIAHVMTLLIKNITTNNFGEYKFSHMFEEAAMASRSFLDLDVRYDNDPYTGQIEMYNSLYYQTFPDPDHIEYDLTRDCEFVMKRARIGKKKLHRLFPNKKSLLANCSPDTEPSMSSFGFKTENPDTGYWGQPMDYGEDIGQTKSGRREPYTVDYFHYMDYQTKKFFIDLRTGEVKDITDAGLKQQEIDHLQQTVPDLAYVPRMMRVPRIAAMCGNTLIEDNVSPFYPHVKGYPIVPCVAYFAPGGISPEKKYQSAVRAIKDPQREINKRYSVGLDLMTKTANAPWIVDVDALSVEGQKNLKKFGSAPGVIIKKKKGTEVKREYPIAAGGQTLQLVALNSDIIKEVSGVNADLMGMQDDKSMSGKALMIRQQAGIMVLQSIYDNLRYSRHIQGKILVGMIQATYSPEKIVRIVGHKKIDRQQAEQILKEFDANTYDLEISETQVSPAFRMAVAEEMNNLREAGIIPPGIADDLIIESSDMPMKREISARVKGYWAAQGVLPPENPGDGQQAQPGQAPQPIPQA